LLVRGGTAPAWSPDGKTIAYRGRCGVRLMTPTGRDVTPRSSGSCGILPAGRPTWSPDGRQLAITTDAAIYVVNKDGTGSRLLSVRKTVAHYGMQPGRASWRPVP
jgi:Tol biopolymer transport system component